MFDRVLEGAIRSRMVRLRRKYHREIFAGTALLSSWSAKIRVGYALAPFGPKTYRRLEQCRPCLAVACLTDVANAIDLPRLISARRETEIGTHRSRTAKAERVIRGGSVSEGSHWTYTRHRHELPANRLRAYQTEQLLVERSDLGAPAGSKKYRSHLVGVRSFFAITSRQPFDRVRSAASTNRLRLWLYHDSLRC